MDEEKIVKPQISKLQQKVERVETEALIKSVEEIPATIEEKVEEESQVRKNENLTRTGHYMADPLFHETCYFFGIEPTEFSLFSKRVSSIVDWAIRKTQSTNSTEILNAIKRLERTLPTPGFSEKRHAIVYRHIRLLSQRDDIDRKLETYKK